MTDLLPIIHNPDSDRPTRRFGRILGFCLGICITGFPGSLFAQSAFLPRDALSKMVAAPFDSTRFVELKSDENSFHSHHGIVSRICYVDDVWLLMQRDEDSDQWHRGAILVRNNTAYYAELDSTPHLAGRACVSCHANGPMLLYGTSSDSTLMSDFNLAMSESGVIDAYVPADDPLPESDVLTVKACTRCHDGIERSKLFGFQAASIYHQAWSGHMPPNRRLTHSERLQVMDWIRTHP